jgi:hypothetical protein
VPEYAVVRLKPLVELIGAERVATLLASFSCPYNEDIELFLKQKAIFFSEQNIANTYLVFSSDHEQTPVFVGYFSLAHKVLTVNANAKLSSKWKRAFNKFGVFEPTIDKYLLSVPLIGQLSKNFANNNDRLIKGSTLLNLALDRVIASQEIVSGRMVYLECNDTPALTDFYAANGFFRMSNRMLSDTEEPKEYLVQMIRYLST